LQLDVIDRAIIMWSNSGETVFTPFMGVGSEVYCAVRQGRKGIGVELKSSSYRQALANVKTALIERPKDDTLFDVIVENVSEEEVCTSPSTPKPSPPNSVR
jgi:DNA modification methylase